MRLAWLGLSSLLFLGAGQGAYAQPSPVAEYALKSTLLFKLPQFVYRERIDTAQPLSVCLLGTNPFGGAPEKLAQSPIGGRSVRYHRISAVVDAGECEFVFISRSETGNLDGVLRRLTAYPVVTVSDIEGFARTGGMVEFALGDDGAAVSIYINRKAAARQGVEFNAQLLRLAKVIDP